MSKKKNLLDFGDAGDEEDFNQLTINKNYADRYDKWRGAEQLQKFKDRYGDPEEEEESSTSEEEWTEEKEKEFFKTFSLLKKKDPKIYDSGVQFFQMDKNNQTPIKEGGKEKEGKAFLLKDHERKMLLEKGPEYGEEEEDVKVEPSYVEEQERIKKRFSEALQKIDSDEEGDEYGKSDLLKKRKKTEREEKVDEDDYRQWLKGEVGKIRKGEAGEELKFLKEYWNDPKLNEDEKFLRDYILNRKYREVGDSSCIPSYEEVIHDSDEQGLSGDEENLQKMEEFEHKYNFRFEEPDQDFIKRYPRTVESTLRRAEDKRKRQRDAAKERKEAEKEKKREEIQRMKAQKRKEILEKLQQLESVSGEAALGFDDEDIEGDFDPEAHDRKMQKIFNDEFYGQGEEEKPVFPSDEELDEEWKAYCPSEEEEDSEEEKEVEPEVKKSKKKKKKKSENVEIPEEPTPGPSKKTSVIEELIEASKGKRGKKKKTSVFLQALERSKPKFNPETYKSYQDYFDEYYKLDFEDLIGDLPCRFKYRKVTPNTFGLSMDEILKAPDRELNQWASLRKTYQYRTPEEENYDLQAYENMSSSRKKQKVLPSLFKTEEEEEDKDNEEEPSPAPEIGKKKKKKNKKKKKKPKTDDQAELVEQEENGAEEVQSEVPEPKKKKKKNKNVETAPDNAELSVPVQEVAPEEVKESKKKRKKAKNGENGEAVSDEPSKSFEETAEAPVKKKSKPETSNGQENGHSKTSGKKRKQNDFAQTEGSKSKRRKDQGRKDAGSRVPVDDDRLRAYGINPTKYKKQLKYGNKK